MKKYEDPEMNMILFDDQTYVKNGIGTEESSWTVSGGGTGGSTIPIVKGDPPSGVHF